MAKITAKDRFYNESGMIAKGFSQPTDRIKRIKKAILDATPMIETERATIVTQVYKETEGLTPIMRRAKVIERLLLDSTIVYVQQGEGAASYESTIHQLSLAVPALAEDDEVEMWMETILPDGQLVSVCAGTWTFTADGWTMAAG